MAKRPGWVRSQAKAAFLTVSALSRALGVHPETLRSWIKKGQVRAVHMQAPRNWHDAAPKTARGRWLVHIDEVERLLTEMYSGGDVPKGLHKRMRRLAAFPEDVVPKSPWAPVAKSP